MRRARGGVVALLLLLHAPEMLAQGRGGGGGGNTCTIDVTGVAFGVYDVFTSSAAFSTGSVTLECGSAVRNVTVSLSPGQSSSYVPRTLVNGGEALAYNLYLDAARTMVWGDGTGGTQQYTNADPPDSLTVTIYGEIPALQDVSAGPYNDSITATINF